MGGGRSQCNFASPREAATRNAAAARERLERSAAARAPSNDDELERAGIIDELTLWRLRVVRVGDGRALCTFKVPRHLTDDAGNWRAGAMVALMDDVGAAAIGSMVGEMKVSVNFDISFFSPAKVEEEVEIDGRVLYSSGRLTAVLVSVRKEGTGEPVAYGRQWMTSTRGSRI